MNLSGLLQLFNGLPPYARLTESLATGQMLPPQQLPPAIQAPLLAKLIADDPRPLLLITGTVDAAPRWQQSLDVWLPPDRTSTVFAEPTPMPYDRAPWSQTARSGRISTLTQLMAGQHPHLPALPRSPIIITSARALLQKTLPRRRFYAGIRVLKQGQLIDVDKLLTTWQGNGYERVTIVEATGQFSQRGGIIDIFAPSAPYPVRIELFGDEIDTLRYFDATTQRSVESADSLQQIVIPPACEALPSDGQAVGEKLEPFADEKEDDFDSWHDDIPALRSGEISPLAEYYLPLMYKQPATLLDYLPDDCHVLVDDWAAVAQVARQLHEKTASLREDQETLPPDMPSPLHVWDDVVSRFENRPILMLSNGPTEDAPPAPALADLVQPGPRFGGQTRPFMAELFRAHELGQRTIVVSRQAPRLAEMWREETRRSNLELNSHAHRAQESLPFLPDDGTITFVTGSLSEGFVLEANLQAKEQDVLVNLLTDAEIFGWRRPAPRRRVAERTVTPETFFADIKPGDYIVHIEFGVGQFLGMVSRNIGGNDREYLQIKYAGNDMLYVPVYHADRMSKWLGPDGGPTLHRMGEKSWKTAKRKAQSAVNDMADELLDLYAARELIDGHAFGADTEWQAEVEASFPYQETVDQARVIEEVKADMHKPTPMDRLICGDVGFGKTEVALRAAFKAVADNKQVAILVPTTVLAQQHWHTFTQRLSPFPLKVALLSRFRTPKQIETTVAGLRDGTVDIVIGTHRLLSADISFKDLGLLIIDEEQRFGVSHKERLKRMRTEVDVLTMTATPIPRTLHMSLAGLRDISVIETPPSERLPIQTYVGPADEGLLKRAIQRERERGGQVFVVHNRVETIGAMKAKITSLVPNATIEIGHGQMKERQLEGIMTRFAAGEIDILISTTIIESGLDIPNANTLIVDRAENFGLSQLYQLRGRIGRGIKRAHAYFFHSPWRSLTDDAQARLETIEENTHLGAGYAIAMKDLEIRGAGELLGGDQSGQIAAVGFDLYTRMLARAVRARKAAQRGELVSTEIPDAALIDLPLATYIPTDYVPDSALRLRLYRRMAGVENLTEIDDFASELADRFGPIPDPVNNLLYQLRIKVLAEAASITQITTDSGQIRMQMPLEDMSRFHLQRYLGEGVRVSRSAVWLSRELSTHEWQVRLVQLLERVAEIDPDAMRAPE